MKLYAPLSYWNATQNELKESCNGCGAKDGIKVPNTMYGLCIKKACEIHDWMYKYGKTQADKLFADAMFRLNMTLIIDSEDGFGSGVLNPFRQFLAGKYYLAVAEWGNNAYWINKTRNLDMYITFKGEFRDGK